MKLYVWCSQCQKERKVKEIVINYVDYIRFYLKCGHSIAYKLQRLMED